MKKHALAASLLAFAMLAAGCSATTGASGSASSGGVLPSPPCVGGAAMGRPCRGLGESCGELRPLRRHTNRL